jgi:hypothetical protein
MLPFSLRCISMLFVTANNVGYPGLLPSRLTSRPPFTSLFFPDEPDTILWCFAENVYCTIQRGCVLQRTLDLLSFFKCYWLLPSPPHPSPPPDRAMAHAFSRWRLSAEARVHSRVSPCGIFGWQTGTGQVFVRVIWFLPSILFYQSSLLICNRGMNNRPVGGRSSETSPHLTDRNNKTTTHALIITTTVPDTLCCCWHFKNATEIILLRLSCTLAGSEIVTPCIVKSFANYDSLF